MNPDPRPNELPAPAGQRTEPGSAADAPSVNAAAATAATDSPPVQTPAPVPRVWVLLLAAVAALALLVSGMLWQRLGSIQEQLARQSADAGSQSIEARTVARQAQALAQETAAKLAVSEVRLSEVALQRTQLEELMQSLSRSRDENLVVDIESSIRLAQQQAQLTGSVQPLLAALASADQRVVRAAQPRLTPLQRAIARDIARIKATSLSDMPALLVKMDELVRLVDDLPLANAVASSPGLAAPKPDAANAAPVWWQRGLLLMGEEARKLLRVSRIEVPEAVLLSPEQSFFVRENIKLKLLNARLGLLARQLESSRADLVATASAVTRYFDPSSRKTQTATALLQQIQTQMKTLELPRVDETLVALATAAAGR
jgi:uroporphyrin-3 C-methyltransferase